MALPLYAARTLSKDLTANMTKRVGRVEKRGHANNATREFRKIQEAPEPTDLAGWRQRARELKRLDGLAGTRVATAEKIAKRDATINRNKEIRDRVSNPNMRINMDKKELDSAAKVLRSDVTRRTKAVKDRYGATPATEKAEKVLSTLKFDSRNESLASVSALHDVSKFKTLSIKGHEENLAHGIEAFGDGYRNFTKEQQSAVWNEMDRQRALQQITSPESMEYVKATLRDNTYKFTEKVNSDGSTTTTVTFGNSFSDASGKAAIKEKRQEIMDSYMNKTPENPNEQSVEELMRDYDSIFNQ